VTFVDETEGLFNNYESGSESDTPFPPPEDRPNGSDRSPSPSVLSRSVVSPSLGSVSVIPGSDTGQTPRTPENSALLGNTDSSTHDESHSVPAKPPIFRHDDYAQLPSPNPSTGKALAEEDPVALTYVEGPYGFQSGVAPQPPMPSIYLDAPVVWIPRLLISFGPLLHFQKHAKADSPLSSGRLRIPQRLFSCAILSRI
jgi:hypothetical protein